MLSRRLRCRMHASLAPARRASSAARPAWLASRTGTSPRRKTCPVLVVVSVVGTLSPAGPLFVLDVLSLAIVRRSLLHAVRRYLLGLCHSGGSCLEATVKRLH